VIIIICYVVFIAFNINHSSILQLMALNSLYCADVPLSNYSLTHYPASVFQIAKIWRLSLCFYQQVPRSGNLPVLFLLSKKSTFSPVAEKL